MAPWSTSVGGLCTGAGPHVSRTCPGTKIMLALDGMQGCNRAYVRAKLKGSVMISELMFKSGYLVNLDRIHPRLVLKQGRRIITTMPRGSCAYQAGTLGSITSRPQGGGTRACVSVFPCGDANAKVDV